MRRRRVVALGALAVLGTTGLSGCASSQLGAAAVVNHDRITVSSVQQSLADIRTLQEKYNLPPSDPALAARNEVQRRVVDLVFEKAAKDLGVTVSDSEVVEAIAAQQKLLGSPAALAQALAASDLSLGDEQTVFRQQVLSKKMSQKIAAANAGMNPNQVNAMVAAKLVAAANAMSIRINPRYGSFNVTSGVIMPVQYDFLRPVRSS